MWILRGFGVGERLRRRAGERDFERAGAAAVAEAVVVDLLFAAVFSRLRLREELELDELLRDELPELEEDELPDRERDELLLSLKHKTIRYKVVQENL